MSESLFSPARHSPPNRPARRPISSARERRGRRGYRAVRVDLRGGTGRSDGPASGRAAKGVNISLFRADGKVRLPLYETMSEFTHREVTAAAEVFSALIVESRTRKSAVVREVGADLEAKLDELAWPLRKGLQVRVEEYRRLGRPPSLLRIIGQSHLEKPFNRIMKWCADVGAEHGFGREFLRELGALAGLPELAEDLATGEIPTVTGETSIDKAGNMPDLVVCTARTALLVENKVRAGESGDQYAPYLLCFHELAGEREARALLCARDLRPVPPGWNSSITHSQLASIFQRLARLDSIPLWGRIAAWQCAAAFADVAPDNAIAEAVQLLSATAAGRITPKQFHRLRELQAIPSSSSMWPS